MNRLATILIVLTIASNTLNAQTIKDSSIFTPQISLSYGAQLPFGDLQDRFGWSSIISLNADFKLASNWVIGASGHFFFGNEA